MSEQFSSDEIKPDHQAFSPVGERWLEKIPCSDCSGYGYHLKKTEKLCPECKGEGFLTSRSGDSSICGRCKGYRSIHAEIKSPCESCRGQGFIPKIFQTFEAYEDCKDCDGDGGHDEEYEEEDEEEREECHFCEGSGLESKSSCYSFEKWKEISIKYPPIGSYIAGANGNSAYGTPDNYFVEIILCPSCDEKKKTRDRISNEGEFSNEVDACQTCGDLSKVIEVTPPCEYCDGQGDYPLVHSKIRHIDCPKCKGAGEFVFSEIREV